MKLLNYLKTKRPVNVAVEQVVIKVITRELLIALLEKNFIEIKAWIGQYKIAFIFDRARKAHKLIRKLSEYVCPICEYPRHEDIGLCGICDFDFVKWDLPD